MVTACDNCLFIPSLNKAIINIFCSHFTIFVLRLLFYHSGCWNIYTVYKVQGKGQESEHNSVSIISVFFSSSFAPGKSCVRWRKEPEKESAKINVDVMQFQLSFWYSFLMTMQQTVIIMSLFQAWHFPRVLKSSHQMYTYIIHSIHTSCTQSAFLHA